VIYLIDTFAWGEYALGTAKGQILRSFFQKKEDKFITLESCLGEIKGYCLRNRLDFRKFLAVVRANSIVLPILMEHWLSAAEIRYHLKKKIPRFGFMDALLVARQKELKCKIISGDPHFESLQGILYMK